MSGERYRLIWASSYVSQNFWSYYGMTLGSDRLLIFYPPPIPKQEIKQIFCIWSVLFSIELNAFFFRLVFYFHLTPQKNYVWSIQETCFSSSWALSKIWGNQHSKFLDIYFRSCHAAPSILFVWLLALIF